VPRHNPPKVIGGAFPSLASDEDRACFLDFQEFADVANWWLTTLESRFRLQELPDDHLRLNVPDDQPMFGRSFAIYYNQSPVGRLEIRSGFPEYTAQIPHVSTCVQLDWSRFLGYRTITEFLDAIASHVTNPSPKSDEYVSARQSVQAALTEMLWDKYGISEFDRVFANEQDMDWGELSVSFHGLAEGYITRRNAWLKKAAANKTATATAPR
jgi:hypothetical protein